MKRFGFAASGRQRYRCLGCSATFTWRRVDCARLRERAWFVRWLREGQSVRQIAAASRRGADGIRSIVRRELAEPPDATAPAESLAAVRCLVADGTYFNRVDGLFAVMDGGRNEVVAGAYGMTEKSRAAPQFLAGLRARGLMPDYATVDGLPALVRAFRAVWPGIGIQRCVVHVQRQGLMWCRARPKRPDARDLRALFLRVAAIRTGAERDAFLADAASWEAGHGPALAREARGPVVDDVVRARSMLLKALPDLFRYLDDPAVPRSTNCIEGYFGRMKRRYRAHCGLAASRRAAYFQWHFTLCRK